ncbi:hypothetical protein DL769_006266 [Monosporascus sp. CRB-8-3]|nr:hypothetical protein DL769_006266 [Monosporascus sp. CRB-8-3]
MFIVDGQNSPNNASGAQPESPIDPALDGHLVPYYQAILHPRNTSLPLLECPFPDAIRYEYLQAGANEDDSNQLKYLFALDLRQCIGVLPRLLGSIIEAIKFLGPASCALSIVEGNSDDGTYEVLRALRPEMNELGVAYFLQSSTIDPTAGERIAKLAQLRNMALLPLVAPSEMPPSTTASSRHLPAASANTSVIFLNDVAPCVTDILELVHQRYFQSAHMTCAMDWTYVGQDPTFYDVWVARTLQGDLFFDIPSDGNWNSAWNLFWNDATTRDRFHRMLPFQVYACWNGIAVFGAGPILGLPADSESSRSGKIGFRAPREGECYGGEPTLFCKDLWWAGYGRIAVVPSVNLEYSDKAAKKIKDLKGYSSRWVAAEDEEATRIQWVDEPPESIDIER